MKSMPKKLKLSTACSQDNPVLKLNSASSDRLLRPFYTRNSDILAKKLLGKILCRRDLVTNETIKNKATSNSIILKARIVETEMYPGVQDPASHSFQGKNSNPMYNFGNFPVFFLWSPPPLETIIEKKILNQAFAENFSCLSQKL